MGFRGLGFRVPFKGSIRGYYKGSLRVLQATIWAEGFRALGV